MRYRETIAAAAMAGSLLSCAHESVAPVRNNDGQGKACRVGSVYRDIFMHDPVLPDKLDAKDDITALTQGLRRRILFLAGPDGLEQAEELCTEKVEQKFCPALRGASVLETAERFSHAVDKCRKDAGSEELDMDCFMSETFGQPVEDKPKFERTDCEKMVYGCYRTVYITYQNALTGKK